MSEGANRLREAEILPEATQLVTRPQGIQKEIAQPEGRGLGRRGIRKGTRRSQVHSTHLKDEETGPERGRDRPKGIVAEMGMESWGEGPRANVCPAPSVLSDEGCISVLGGCENQSSSSQVGGQREREAPWDSLPSLIPHTGPVLTFLSWSPAPHLSWGAGLGWGEASLCPVGGQIGPGPGLNSMGGKEQERQGLTSCLSLT